MLNYTCCSMYTLYHHCTPSAQQLLYCLPYKAKPLEPFIVYFRLHVYNKHCSIASIWYSKTLIPFMHPWFYSYSHVPCAYRLTSVSTHCIQTTVAFLHVKADFWIFVHWCIAAIYNYDCDILVLINT